MDAAETDLKYIRKKEKIRKIYFILLTTSYERLNIFIIHDTKESPTHVVVVVVVIVVIVIIIVVVVVVV